MKKTIATTALALALTAQACAMPNPDRTPQTRPPIAQLLRGWFAPWLP